jgi:hypothetical protein
MRGAARDDALLGDHRGDHRGVVRSRLRRLRRQDVERHRGNRERPCDGRELEGLLLELSVHRVDVDDVLDRDHLAQRRRHDRNEGGEILEGTQRTRKLASLLVVE